jgi:hypothetical protein
VNGIALASPCRTGENGGLAGEGGPMTEAEWLACRDPERMLESLRGTAGGRKLRLFACACCRRVLRLMPASRSGRKIEVAERLADGQAGESDRAEAFERRRGIPHDHSGWALLPGPFASAHLGSRYAGHAVEMATRVSRRDAARRGEWASQASLLRCVFGDPFRPVEPGPWITPAATTVARDCYERRDFTALPLLADLLEESGCPEQRVLDHCRHSGEHARGCWVVDLVLGKV